MASKRRLSLTPSPKSTNPDTDSREMENSSRPTLCLVCSDKARFINYGALSCQSCKTFFRRNGFRPETVRPCAYNQSCDINMQTRHSCAYCRVAKCFSVGMSSDLIRKEDRKKAKISSPATTNCAPTEQILTTQPTIRTDLIQDNPSLLSGSDWILVSNILSAYDTYSSVSTVCRMTQNLLNLPIELELSPIYPSEILRQMFTSIRSCISSSPDFCILDTNEQISLFARNLHGIVGFYSVLFFKETNMLQNDRLMSAVENLYSSEAISSIKSIQQHSDLDSTSFKLFLLVLAFSTNSLIIRVGNRQDRDALIHGTFRIMASQNVYSELLWKYLIYRYGVRQSIVRLAGLMHNFLSLSKHLSLTYTNNSTYHNLIDGIMRQIQQSLANSDQKETRLWGKI